MKSPPKPIRPSNNVLVLRRRLGDNLRALRKQRGLSQARLSRQAKLHLRYYQKVEGEKVNVSFDVLVRIKTALQCRWEDIFRNIG